ncbi:MAG: DUF4836 family protein [Bacteroidaceae bacterium]|nr:DUF4836 family protein [Bacteroidaceae bacterium]
MKRRALFLILFLLVVIASLLFWFIGKGRNDTASIIPQDARAVAVLDVNGLSRDAGLDADKILSRLGIAQANEAGLNLSAPVYGFVSGQGHFGIALSVKSKSRLKKALQQLGADVESLRSYQWSMVRSWMVVFDSSRLLVLGPVSATEATGLRGQMVSLMKQKQTDSPVLGELRSRPGSLRLISRLDVMPKAYVGTLRKWLPAGIDFSRVSAFVSLDAQDKSFTLNTELLSEDRQVKQALAQADSLWQPIRGQLIEQGPESPVLWATAGLRGDRLLNLLRQNPTIRTRLIALNMCVDADMMIRSINGDVSLSVPSISLNFKQPPLLLTASLDNKDFLRNVDSWKSGLATDAGIRFRVLHDNDFYLSAGDVNAYFGVRGNQLYVTTNPRLADQACRPASAQGLQALLPKMQGRVFFATFDASSFMRGLGPLVQLLGASNGILQLLGSVERINISATNSHDIALEVQCNQELKDILKP